MRAEQGAGRSAGLVRENTTAKVVEFALTLAPAERPAPLLAAKRRGLLAPQALRAPQGRV